MKLKILLPLFFSLLMGGTYAQSLQQGKDLLYYNRPASAEVFFHNFIKQYPANGEAWLLLVKAYASNDRSSSAHDTLKKAAASLHEDPFLLVAKGILQLETERADSAQVYFENAVNRVKGKDPLILGYVAEANSLYRNGNHTWAIELARKAVKNKKVKNDPWYDHIIGKCYHQMHNGGEAFRAYTAATGKNSSYAASYYELGQIFKSQSNPGMYLEYFRKAVMADEKFAPAHYELYRHYLYRQPDTAMVHFNEFLRHADPAKENEYDYVDLLYLTRDYEEAIAQGKKLLSGSQSPARLYKLVAYCYGELKDTTTAISYMEQYFQKAPDSVVIARDYETMGDFYSSAALNQPGKAISQYTMAAGLSSDSTRLIHYYSKLAALYKLSGDYAGQAHWLGKFYAHNEKAGNVDLFNWGIAAYRSENYALSDSVFTIYTAKYPEQGFGYYWRAKSNAAIDSTMEKGLAVPIYEQLIEVAKADSVSATNKSWLREAYGYLAAFETNNRKNYEQAIEYFERILEIDPDNASAKNYIKMLETNLQNEADTNR